MEDYHAFMSVGVNYTGKMDSEPSSFPAGVLGQVPTTTFLRYTMPSYVTVDASIGISKDEWSAQIYGSNLNNSNASTATTSGQFIVSEVPLRPRVGRCEDRREVRWPDRSRRRASCLRSAAGPGSGARTEELSGVLRLQQV